ncbi:hypothetical protein [Ligilactobacillus ceti]|uniref:hypothetical protein n=1 Tax=Ligilactobacillus ceti TaxID=395085 RepID=UPI0012DF7FD6|nr:hypothetical protein [Ligilactobacillus ceti]
MTKNIDEKICDVLLEISNKTKSIADNLKKLNKLKGEENGKSQRSICNRRRT